MISITALWTKLNLLMSYAHGLASETWPIYCMYGVLLVVRSTCLATGVALEMLSARTPLILTVLKTWLARVPRTRLAIYVLEKQ